MKRFYLLACLSGAITAVLILADPAIAARNAAGTYSLPAGNPYVPGSVISSATVNSTLSDLGGEITDSLSRSGKGGLTAAMRGTDGTVAAPSYSWTNETGSGLYRIGASDLGLAIAGVKREEWTATATTLLNQALFSSGTVAAPALSFSSETGTGFYRNGAGDIRLSLSGADKTLWNATGFGIGVSPAWPLHVKAAGSGATAVANTVAAIENSTFNYLSLLAPNSASSALVFGDVALANRGYINYYNSTNASADQMQFGTNGTNRMIVSNSGVAIGATGTAISASYRGTVVWNPGTLAAGASGTNTITVTGAAAGADCMSGVNTPATGVPVVCNVTANTCNITILNQSAGNLVLGSATFFCRVFNP